METLSNVYKNLIKYKVKVQKSGKNKRTANSKAKINIRMSIIEIFVIVVLYRYIFIFSIVTHCYMKTCGTAIHTRAVYFIDTKAKCHYTISATRIDVTLVLSP